ncbi:hypothetical protein [Nocardia alba]|uniref:Uncharacterized protein n=1 Tax=Nocardia alba TaxID=225051 RepID=A0A4R1FL82_9NOCA|nr:hypothetical protein [Nocardia alba]TCJ95547.1 hypothetical protein DFR71_4462 [Nocardia alba]
MTVARPHLAAQFPLDRSTIGRQVGALEKLGYRTDDEVAAMAGHLTRSDRGDRPLGAFGSRSGIRLAIARVTPADGRCRGGAHESV